jgi:hypothetical protein
MMTIQQLAEIASAICERAPWVSEMDYFGQDKDGVRFHFATTSAALIGESSRAEVSCAEFAALTPADWHELVADAVEDLRDSGRWPRTEYPLPEFGASHCACGAELMGKRVGLGQCGDCDGRDNKPIAEHVPAEPLDQRIANANYAMDPLHEWTAWSTPGWES